MSTHSALRLATLALGSCIAVATAFAGDAPAPKPPQTQPAKPTAGAQAKPASQPAPKPTPKADEPLARSQEKDWVERHKKLVARAAEGNVDVLFLGDFFTEAWCIGGKHGYGARGRKIFAEYYEQLAAVRFGIRGDATQNLLFRINDGELDGIKPKAIVLQVGINNLNTHTPEEIAGGIKAILTQLQRKTPESKIILMGLFPAGSRATHPVRARISEVNNLLAKLGDDKAIFYLDLGPKLLAPDGSLTAEISDDGLNLTPKGYTIWAQAINPRLEEWLGRKIEPQKPVPVHKATTQPKKDTAPAARTPGKPLEKDDDATDAF